jgi:hypothetical protein
LLLKPTPSCSYVGQLLNHSYSATFRAVLQSECNPARGDGFCEAWTAAGHQLPRTP